jgi:SAM-dependent methyltransferase
VYHQWADEYDAAMAATGYLHWAVISSLVTRHVPRADAAILDAGAGTGFAGTLLSLLGYNNLHALDMSEAMLAKAAARKCYSSLKSGVLGESLDYVDSSFDAIISTGTFTTGHAPATAFDELVRILEPGGMMMFTCGALAWEENGFRGKLEALVNGGVLLPVDVTPLYCPMPFSATENGFAARAHVYRKI